MKRVVAIVGITGPIGSAIASAMLKSAALTVVGFGRAGQPPAHVPPCTYMQADFANVSDLNRATELLSERQFDRIDFVHAAGYFGQYETLLDQSIEDIQNTVSANYLTLALAIKVWLPLAVKVRNGHFVGFSSVSVTENFPFLATYSSAKAAIESLVRSVANEVLIEDVTLNCLRLPTVKTPAEVRLKPHADIAHWLTPDEVGEITASHLNADRKPRGAAIPVYKPSNTYFGESLLQRFGKSKNDLIS